MLKYSESWGIRVNKSHAAAYATISYMTGWLKYHYPAEYMASVMSNTKLDKLPKLVNSSRKMGLKLLPPNINLSQDGFSVDNEGNIIFGFRTIKGVGNGSIAIIEERNANGAFTSMHDFIYRIMTNQQGKVKKSVIGTLISAGAFDEFCDGNRASLLNGYEDLIETIQKITKAQERVKEKEKALAELSTKKEKDKAERELKNATDKLKMFQSVYTSFTFSYAEEDLTEKLNTEHSLLGFYFSGSPLEEYSEAIAAVNGHINISDAVDVPENTNVNVCGIITNLEILHRKKDGKPFVTFTLIDDTDEIETKCFVNKYEINQKYIEEGAVVAISGKTRAEVFSVNNESEDDDEEIQRNILTVDKVSPLSRNTNEKIIIVGETPFDWVDNYDEIKKYESQSGNVAFWCDNMDLRLRKIAFRISKNILEAKIPNVSISLSKH